MSTPLPRRPGPARLLLVVLLAAALALTGCSGDTEPTADATSTAPTTTPPVAKKAPTPSARACFRLSYEQSLKPVIDAAPVRCRATHTVQTVHVGHSALVVRGHLLAVDSERAQARVRSTCPARFNRFVGGSTEQRRLSMLVPLASGPTLAESDEGQDWFRCTVVALAGPEQLASLSRSMRGVLDSASGRARWGRCATAKPGNPGARHVLCSVDDAWRAVATVDVPAGRRGAWPGTGRAARAGARCEDEVRRLADDPLKFTWGYEPPDARQWAAGQRYGFCWAPGR